MTYIYDVTLNFNDILYDFFEWNSSDTLLHVRKIPIFKVSNEDFINCLLYDIAIDDKTLNTIKEKTELYGKKNKDITSCLIRSEDNIIALLFDENGKTKEISSIIVEEELDILEIKTNKCINLNYKTLNKRKQITSTRYEKMSKSYLQKQINKLNINKDSEKIKYMYFEYFGNFINDETKALAKLKKEINSSSFSDSLKDFFKLSNTKR